MLASKNIMPTNKNAQLRYRILDECFRDRTHKYFIEDLVNKVNEALYDLYGNSSVSLRQIREDIKNMRERLMYNAPIKAYPCEGKKCYYRYEDPDFSIFNSDLSLEELENLSRTIEILGRYEGLPENAWLYEMLPVLEGTFGINPNIRKVVCLQQNRQLRELQYLPNLIDAASKHQVLVIYYSPFIGNARVTTVHPYYLKQYNSRWFLFGYEEETGRITNKALDRIIRFEPSNNKFRINTNIDFEHYFDDVVGVTVPSSVASVHKQTVKLRFTARRFPYVESKPLHHSQHTIDSGDHVVSIEVYPTLELDQQILSFGEDVEVLEPQDYRNHIEGIVQEMAKNYFVEKNGCTDGK